EDGANPVKDARAIVAELKKYDVELFRKPRWLVLNKSDLLPEDTREKALRAFVRKLGWKGKTFIISALTGEGCRELVYAIMAHLEEQRAAAHESEIGADAAQAPATDRSTGESSRA
ncbi:MAG TPA: GTPase ObgE, partial [Burkholderiales bacterium]|nr:GTPase ObgE [Burkholderiales bacterium]